MHPILISWGDGGIPTYGVMYLAGFLAAIGVVAHQGPKVGIPRQLCIDLGFAMMIAGELGSRIAYVVVEWDRVRSGTLSWSGFFYGGRVVLAGVIAGFAFTCWAIRRHGIRPANVADVSFLATALGMAIGRLGCFAAGCCYGTPAGGPFAVVFRDVRAAAWHETPLGVPLVPVQLVQSATALVGFFLLSAVHARRRFVGQTAGVFFLYTGATRIVTETWRGDARGTWAGVSTSAWIGLAMIAWGVGWLWFCRRKARAVGFSPRPAHAR